MTSYSRRHLLAATAGVAALGSTAGCLDAVTPGRGAEGRDGESDETVLQASFFVFGDLVSQVAGEAATAELLVPIGQHGHGWEPGPRVREAIRTADGFVHGMAGFQPWVDDILHDLRADGEQLVTVDVSAEVSLLAAGEDHNHGETHDEDHDGEEGHDDEHDAEETHGDHDAEEGHDGAHDDDQRPSTGQPGSVDPHFWTDPRRMQDAVDTVREALVEIDPGNEDTYTRNAAAYRDRLDDLHARIASTVEAASRDVILVAGHDSFQYFGDRYGVQIEALTTVSPDDQPTLRDIEQAQRVIDDHGLQYICADPLESQQAAEQLVAETDAEAVLPLTAMPGLSDDWAENDWGYLEIMEQVNLPTLERALDAV